MTVTGNAIGKWLAIVGAIASAVIGSVGVATLPDPVRVALIVIGAVVVAVERVLATTIPLSITTKLTTKKTP
jgi:hypothetical protein